MSTWKNRDLQNLKAINLSSYPACAGNYVNDCEDVTFNLDQRDEAHSAASEHAFHTSAWGAGFKCSGVELREKCDHTAPYNWGNCRKVYALTDQGIPCVR